jgi:hypothetical protein
MMSRPGNIGTGFSNRPMLGRIGNFAGRHDLVPREPLT